jgi:L-ascorbate metabolism protein UlaG (beta-lactamase superfamily)
MTHDHYDHNACRVIKGEHKDLKFAYGENEVHGGIKVVGHKSWHDHEEGAERGANTIYTFEMEGITICHCGDLGCMPSDDVIECMKGVDFLFVPVGEVYTMEVPEIKTLIERVNPRIIVPMHYMVGGLSFRLSPLDKFLDIIPNNATDFIGNELEIIKADLPEDKECWVFDR